MGYHEQLALTNSCNSGSNNSIAIAILNGNVHSHLKKRGEYADYSPCHTFFDNRYAIGLHKAKLDDMKRFQSREDYHNYVSKIFGLKQ